MAWSCTLSRLFQSGACFTAAREDSCLGFAELDSRGSFLQRKDSGLWKTATDCTLLSAQGCLVTFFSASSLMFCYSQKLHCYSSCTCFHYTWARAGSFLLLTSWKYSEAFYAVLNTGVHIETGTVTQEFNISGYKAAAPLCMWVTVLVSVLVHSERYTNRGRGWNREGVWLINHGWCVYLMYKMIKKNQKNMRCLAWFSHRTTVDGWAKEWHQCDSFTLNFFLFFLWIINRN